MVYANVKEESEEKLHLVRDPEARGWAILIGLISLGLGAAFFSNDYLLWKITYVSGAVFVGLNCMEDWEDCMLDKTTRQVTISRQTLIQKLFQLTSGARVTTGSIDEIIRVSVESEEVKHVGNGYSVVLFFAPGFSFSVIETATFGDKSEHELIAAKIHKFLDLDSKEEIPESPVIEDVTETIPPSSSSDDDDSFEQITKSDVIDAPDDPQDAE